MSLTIDQRNAATKLITAKLQAIREDKIRALPGFEGAKGNAEGGNKYEKLADAVTRVKDLQAQIDAAQEEQRNLASNIGAPYSGFYMSHFTPWAEGKLKEITEENLAEWLWAQPGYSEIRKIEDAIGDVELSIELATSPGALKQLVIRLQSEHGFEVSATVKTALGIPSKE